MGRSCASAPQLGPIKESGNGNAWNPGISVDGACEEGLQEAEDPVGGATDPKTSPKPFCLFQSYSLAHLQFLNLQRYNGYVYVYVYVNPMLGANME